MTLWRNLVVALVAAFALAACSSSDNGGGTDTDVMELTPQETCEEGGGRWNADDTCTSAEQLAAEAAAARAATQRSAIMTAIGTASTAVAAVDNDSTDAEVSAADDAIADARTAIANADDVPDAETAANSGTVDALASRLTAAKMARQTAMDDAQRAADMAMAATAAKLHSGIYAPAADATGTAVGAVHAAYNDADAPDAGDAADTFIMVTTGDGTAANTQALSEDKDTMVATLNGWTGKQYTASGTDVAGTYEAMVYSHVGDPTQGDKFGQIGVTTAADGYEYGLNAEGFLSTDVETTPTQIASPSFDQSAGVKSFELGTNRQYVSISGTYHGVSGEYRCTPDTSNSCAAQVAAEGFNLGGVTAANAFNAANAAWTFKPTNPEARVMSTPDSSYASYGWWLHTAANGDLTASAFVDRRGATENASGLTALNGTATYMGSAVGKYALSSTTGGTNDAGHFTARAMLEANFTGNTTETAITGTIDQFMGADDQSRDWSVKLNGSQIGDTGNIGLASPSTAVDTVWTIGGTAADESGNWTGSLQENGDDGVPAIATGTFYTEYGTAGKMVGAFGANKQ